MLGPVLEYLVTAGSAKNSDFIMLLKGGSHPVERGTKIDFHGNSTVDILVLYP